MADARTRDRLARNRRRALVEYTARLEIEKKARSAKALASMPSEEERRKIRLWYSYGMELEEIQVTMPQFSLYRIRNVLRASGKQYWEGLDRPRYY